jgi:hypothetical protein
MIMTAGYRTISKADTGYFDIFISRRRLKGPR